MSDASTVAELAAIADAVDRELARVRDLASRRAAHAAASGDEDTGICFPETFDIGDVNTALLIRPYVGSKESSSFIFNPSKYTVVAVRDLDFIPTNILLIDVESGDPDFVVDPNSSAKVTDFILSGSFGLVIDASPDILVS